MQETEGVHAGCRIPGPRLFFRGGPVFACVAFFLCTQVTASTDKIRVSLLLLLFESFSAACVRPTYNTCRVLSCKILPSSVVRRVSILRVYRVASRRRVALCLFVVGIPQLLSLSAQAAHRI